MPEVSDVYRIFHFTENPTPAGVVPYVTNCACYKHLNPLDFC